MAQANADPLVTVWDALERADCRPFGPARISSTPLPGPRSSTTRTASRWERVRTAGRCCGATSAATRTTSFAGSALLWSDLFPAGHKHGSTRGRTEA
jgi:hypothetical protein